MTEYIYNPPASLPPGSDVIAYLRDSGGPNQEDSIGQQERILKEYCKKHGLILSRVYSDTASGRKTKGRESFLAMCNSVMSSSERAAPRGLLLWAYSRFSRDIVDFNYYLYGLLKHGLVVHSLTEEIPEGLLGQMMLSVKAYTNADYSIQLGKQIKRGIADRVKAGYSNGGQAPRGYQVVRELHDSRRNGAPRVGVKWEIDLELAPLVRLAWELRGQGKGYADIIRATGGRLYTNKNSFSCHFQNKSYLGIGKAGELEVPDHHEPLITWEMWEAVKRVEAASPRHGQGGKLLHPRRIKHPSLLSGLCFCIYCGSAMVLHTSADYRSYACGSHDRQRVYRDCEEARRVNARKADKVILDVVLNRILTPEFVPQLLEDIQKKLVDTTKIDREIGEANDLLLSTKRSIGRLIKLAEGTGDLSEITSRLRQLKQEEAEVSALIKGLRVQRSVEIPQITSEALALVFDTWHLQIKQALQCADVLAAKALLACFVQKIELGYKSAIIHYTFPLAPADEDAALRAHSLFGRLPYSLEIRME